MNNIKIISVEAKKGYYLVTTSENDYKFEEDTIVKYEVFNDKEFTKAEFNKILSFNDNQVAFNKALRYLGYGPRSKMEMLKYLKEKGFNNYKDVIKRLSEYGYIDDKKLAKDMVSYYIDLKKGPLYILKKMNEKAISDEVASVAINEYSKDLEEELCLELSKDLATKLSEYPVKKQKTTLYSRLISKGYPPDVIRHTIEKTEFVDESDSNLVKDYEKLKAKVSKKELSEYEARNYIVEHLLAKGYEYKKIKDILE